MSPELKTSHLKAQMDIESWNQRNQASRAVFNVVGHGRFYDGTLLASKPENGEEPIVLELSRREFQLVQIICVSPIKSIEIAALLGLSHKTIRNQFVSIFKKAAIIGLSYGCRELLIHKLLESGVLSYEPSVKSDSFTNFQPK